MNKDVILSDRLYVPIKTWKNIPSDIRKNLLKLFNKVYISPSSYCELLASGRDCYTHSEVKEEKGDEAAQALCYNCPQGRLKVSCVFKTNGYASFYRGDEEKIDKVLAVVTKYNKQVHINDKRVLAPLKKSFSIKETGDERSISQNELAKKYVDTGYGILVAAARFGKTRMACVVSSMLKQRTFVLAHQKELLEQFHSNWLKFSSLKEKDIKINPSVDEAKKLPVSLFTYQHFLQKHGKERLKDLAKVPGLVIVDEAHKAGANEFCKVVNAFHARYRLGITATPDRKDKLSFRIYNTFGPVTAEGGVEMLTCKYKLLSTGTVFEDYDRVPHRRRFVYLNKAMVKAEDRNSFIANRAVRNVEKGYQVLIPLKSVAHVKDIAKQVRDGLKEKGFIKVRVCEFSASIVKGKKREEVSQQIRDGYYDVVVAVESMINVGFDAPHMSNIILNAGSYSFNLENRYQLFSRIRTKCEGKKIPLIDVLVDTCKWSAMSTKGIVKQLEKFGFTEVKSKRKKKDENSRGCVLNME